jgi:hypothetical protein
MFVIKNHEQQAGLSRAAEKQFRRVREYEPYYRYALDVARDYVCETPPIGVVVYLQPTYDLVPGEPVTFLDGSMWEGIAE